MGAELEFSTGLLQRGIPLLVFGWPAGTFWPTSGLDGQGESRVRRLLKKTSGVEAIPDQAGRYGRIALQKIVKNAPEVS
jgi:hypothetical protein